MKKVLAGLGEESRPFKLPVACNGLSQASLGGAPDGKSGCSKICYAAQPLTAKLVSSSGNACPVGGITALLALQQHFKTE